MVANGWSPNSKSKVKVLDVFRVERPDEIERFEPFKNIRPRKLLWYVKLFSPCVESMFHLRRYDDLQAWFAVV